MVSRILAVFAGAIVLTIALLLGTAYRSTGATSPPALTVGPASRAARMTAAQAIVALAKDNGITTLPYAASVTTQFGAFSPVTAPAGDYWAVTLSGVHSGELQTHGGDVPAFFHTVTYIVDDITGKVVQDGEDDATLSP